jgi:hypothetical protein
MGKSSVVIALDERETNYRAPAGTRARPIRRDIYMALYDSLPKDIKEVFDDAPVQCDPMTFVQAVDVLGPMAKEKLIEALQKSFPGWRPNAFKRFR